MSKGSHSVQIPADLGERIQVLFRLGSKPKTLGELGDLLQEYIKKCLKEPRLKAHFWSIYKGDTIFGHVDYETRHRVLIPDGRQVYVACAFDALVEGFFLPVEIDSICFHCGQRIQIKIAEGTVNSVEPSSTVLWLGASKKGDSSCFTNLCPYINFFSSPEHVAEWKDKNPYELGMMLTLKQSLELARKGYWHPLSLLKTKT